MTLLLVLLGVSYLAGAFLLTFLLGLFFRRTRLRVSNSLAGVRDEGRGERALVRIGRAGGGAGSTTEPLPRRRSSALRLR